MNIRNSERLNVEKNRENILKDLLQDLKIKEKNNINEKEEKKNHQKNSKIDNIENIQNFFNLDNYKMKEILNKKENYKKRDTKLEKIKSLFIIRNFKNLNFFEILKSWSNLKNILIFEKSQKDKTSYLISDQVLSQYYNMIQVFDQKNRMYIKFKKHTFLYISFICLIFYIFQHQKKIFQENKNSLKKICDFLIKNCYYLSLILIKSVENNILKLDLDNLEKFTNSLKNYNFETGIAFIKTFKNNNKLIFNKLKKMYFSINHQKFEKIEEDFMSSSISIFGIRDIYLKFFFEKTEKNIKIKKSFGPKIIQNLILEKSKKIKNYVLVLDLDETLVHFSTKDTKFLIRPHAYDFIYNLSFFFEIVIFTAAQQEYADWILDRLDQKKIISKRFYRKNCEISKLSHNKNLNKIQKNLDNIIIVDNFPQNFEKQRGNGICIKSWFGDFEDKTLVFLENDLLNMINQKPKDVKIYMQQNFLNSHHKGFMVFPA